MDKARTRSRPLLQLRWKDIRHVERSLGCDRAEFVSLFADASRHYRFRKITDAKGKQREVCSTHGRLRELQDRLLLCLGRVTVADPVHGSVPGRSSVGNAKKHASPKGFVKVDIKDCFPSISHRRIYRIFCERLGCSPDVARLLTKLTTVNGKLPQGVSTSPFLAALATERLAKRLNGLAASRGGRATMYVDDGTLSGPVSVTRTLKAAKSIVQQEGFRPHPTKCVAPPPGQPKVVTGVRVDGGIDAPPGYAEEVSRLLHEYTQLTTIENCDSVESQRLDRTLRGKLAYLAQLNPGAAKPIRAALNKHSEHFRRVAQVTSLP